MYGHTSNMDVNRSVVRPQRVAGAVFGVYRRENISAYVIENIACVLASRKHKDTMIVRN